jgi:integrase/recombinase XerD
LESSTTAAVGTRLLEHFSDQLHRIPLGFGPRHLVALLILLAVGYVARHAPDPHGQLAGALPDSGSLPDPELYIAGLTGGGLWERYKLTISMDGRHEPSTVAQWGEVWDDWLVYLHAAGCRRRPGRCDRGEGCKGIPWQRARERHLKAFLDLPCRSGPRKGMAKTVATRAAYLKAIKPVYQFAVRKRILSRDPFADVRPPKVGDGLAIAFSRDQLAKILTAAAGHADRRIYIMCWLGYHGLRCMEIAGLRREHVRLDDEPVLLVHGKGSNRREVPVMRLFVPVLAEWTRDMGTFDPLIVAHDNQCRPTAQPLSPSRISGMLSDFIRHDAGVGGSAHRLRHTAATFMLDEGDGENLHHVSRFLGHARLDTTMIYVRAHQWNVRKWVDRMPDPADPTRRQPQPQRLGELLGEALRQTLTPEMSRRLRDLPEDLAATYRPLLELGHLLAADQAGG